LASEGYIVLATGPIRYVELAANLAASIRVKDPKRRVCLVHDGDGPLPDHLAGFFHDTARLTPDARYPHVMNKLRLFDLSPYERTMYVDADCLLAKDDVDDWWAMAATRPFSITGGRITGGEWKGVDIGALLKAEGIDYVVKMNAGVYYFDRSAAAAAFWRGLNEFYLGAMDRLNISYYRGEKTQTDELYLGVWMARLGMDADNMRNRGGNSWMVSTWRAPFVEIDIARGRSVIWKCDRFLWGLPVLPTKLVRLSPTFPHFIGLKPRRVYDRAAAEFRRLAALG
jgi:hypothetical protein